jgi:hypothetical protein
MFRKTFSQKVAIIFEVVGYLLLVPAILSLIYPLLFVVGSLFSLQIPYLVISLIPFLIFGLGIVLLAGYVKHSRGTLDEEKIIPLWVGTLFYNVLPLLPVFYQILMKSDELDNFSYQQLLSPFALFCIFLVLWWIAAVLLSIGAIFSELRENQQYR